MEDLGDPTSYLTVATGVPVYTSDGERVGTVDHVLADEDVDVFDGIVVKVDGGHRFADADQIASLHDRGVVLSLDAKEAAGLHEPTANAAVLDATPDDTVRDDTRDRLRRAWDWISGNY